MTQLGEGVAIGIVSEIPVSSEEAKKREKPKPCHVKVRVKRPSGKGPWYAFGALGGSEPGDDLTGHAFCAHLDEGGSASWHGFYPRGALDGWENLPAADQISSTTDFFKYVAGVLHHGDADHAYDDEKVWKLSRERYDKAQAFAQQWESDKTKYSLALNNCTTYAVRDGTSAGCPVPSGGFPFANPASFGKKLARTK